MQEAETLIADRANQSFNYGQELLRIASGGRGHLAGADAVQGATEAAGRMWELLWRPEAYAGTQTWETRFPMSAQRGGIRGTIRAVANNLIGHFAQRLRKGRASISTLQQSQIGDTDSAFDVAGRASNRAGEWEEWRSAIIQELANDLHDELARNQGGKHGEARVRNLRWAIAIAEKQMAIPYHWRSMPEVMAEIPELRGVGRGQGQIVFAQAIFRPRVDFGKRPANDSPGFRPNHGGEPCPSLRFLRCRSRTTLPT